MSHNTFLLAGVSGTIKGTTLSEEEWNAKHGVSERLFFANKTVIECYYLYDDLYSYIKFIALINHFPQECIFEVMSSNLTFLYMKTLNIVCGIPCFRPYYARTTNAHWRKFLSIWSIRDEHNWQEYGF